MARSARKISESGMYHVLLRSLDRIFDTETDYIKFIAIMKECFLKYGGLLGYILLPNRIHIVILDNSGNLSVIIRSITIKYSKYKKIPVFYDRFKCEILKDNTELSQLLAFIGSPPLLSESKFVFCSEINNNNESCPTDTKELKNRKENFKEFRMFMDDYKNMPEHEIKKFIEFVAQVNADDIRNLADRHEYIKKIVKNCPISNRRLAEILGINRNCFNGISNSFKNDNSEKNSDSAAKNIDRDSGRELDVWLL